MSAIVQRINRPAVLIGKIGHTREGRVLETESHTRGIDVRGDANDRIHQLVEQSAVRNNQVTPGGAPQKAVQRLPCPQEEGPIAFPRAANRIIGCDVGRLGPFPNLFGGQTFHLADVTLEQNGIELHGSPDSRSDDLRRLFRAPSGLAMIRSNFAPSAFQRSASAWACARPFSVSG